MGSARRSPGRRSASWRRPASRSAGGNLSDLCAGLVGGLGVVPGANIGRDCAVFEAVHGSAPDIAGRGLANPVAVILSSALMLCHIGEDAAADRVDAAVASVLADPQNHTRDLGGDATTEQVTNAIIKAMEASAAAPAGEGSTG